MTTDHGRIVLFASGDTSTEDCVYICDNEEQFDAAVLRAMFMEPVSAEQRERAADVAQELREHGHFDFEDGWLMRVWEATP